MPRRIGTLHREDHWPIMIRSSLKLKFAATIAVAYLVVGTLTYLALDLVTGKVVRTLSTRFAVKQALLEKSKLMSTLQRDLSLSLRMADSPLLRRWALDEDNAGLKRLAREELEGYRTSFRGKSAFFIIDRSRHYYFNDGTALLPYDRPAYTLDPGNVNDAWYFRVMRHVGSFELNVDYDNHLDQTKVWFNVVMKDSAGRKVALAGSGIDITEFINDVVHSNENGVETILISRDGSIEGHRDKRYVFHNSKIRNNDKKTTIYDLITDEADRQTLRKAIETLSSGTRETETCYLTLQGRRYLAAMAHLKEIGWYNLVLVDPANALGSRDLLPLVAITIISLLVVTIIIALQTHRAVLAPLSALTRCADEIARGNFSVRMPVRSRDEIGTLAASFNEMARMIRDHTENLEQKVSERTEELNRANRSLAESNRTVMDSIRYAQLIQASRLPAEGHIRERIRDFFILYQPRDIVGGDSYYFQVCGDDFLIAVMDCTGHGVPGAFMTMTAAAVLDRVLDTVANDDPAAILMEFNRLMKATLHHGTVDTAVDNGLEIGLCCCSPSRRMLVFAGARMDLYHAGTDGVGRIAGDRQAIGYRRSDPSYAYTNRPMTVTEGMTFYLASDGILDQCGGARGWGFGRKRFNELLAGISSLPAVEQQVVIEREIAAYRGSHPQRDDITVIGFRF